MARNSIGNGTLCAYWPDGTQKWAFETEKWTTTSPALGADGTLVIACYCFLYVFSP